MNRKDLLSFLGDSLAIPDERTEALRNIRLITRIRWFVSPFIFLLLFLSTVLGFSKQTLLSQNQLAVNGINMLVILLMNLTYIMLVKRVKNLGPLVTFQLLIDVVHFSITIYKTGGVTSPFGFLYFMVIFSSSILSTAKGAYLTAGLAAALYSLMNYAELSGFIPHQDYFSPLAGLEQNYSFVALSWSFSIFSYFAFAALASFLTRLIRDRERKLKASHEVLAKKVDTLSLLYETSRALSAYGTVKEVVDYILQELIGHLKLDRALLYLNIKNEYLHLYMVKERIAERAVSTYDDTNAAGTASDRKRRKQEGVSVPEAETAQDGQKKPIININIPLREGAGLTARCALTREPFNIAKPEESPYINKELAQKIGMNPFALAPLVLRERTVGVLGIDRSFRNGFINEEEFRILQMFANQAAITIGSLQDIDREFRAFYGV